MHTLSVSGTSPLTDPIAWQSCRVIAGVAER